MMSSERQVDAHRSWQGQHLAVDLRAGPLDARDHDVGGDVEIVEQIEFLVDEGDAGALRMTLSRALHANIRNASGTEIGTAAAPIRTDPTGTTGQPVTNAGTFAVQADGGVAHDAVNSGNPLCLGAEAIAHGTNPTAVAAADRTKLYANRAGIPFVIGGHPNVVTIEVATTGAATDAAIVTVSSGTKIVVTQVQVTTDNANTAFPQIRVGFGTANTPTTTAK